MRDRSQSFMQKNDFRRICAEAANAVHFEATPLDGEMEILVAADLVVFGRDFR